MRPAAMAGLTLKTLASAANEWCASSLTCGPIWSKSLPSARGAEAWKPSRNSTGAADRPLRQQRPHRPRPFRRCPDRPGAHVMAHARVDAERGVDGRKQIAFADGVVHDLAAIAIGRAVMLPAAHAAA